MHDIKLVVGTIFKCVALRTLLCNHHQHPPQNFPSPQTRTRGPLNTDSLTPHAPPPAATILLPVAVNLPMLVPPISGIIQCCSFVIGLFHLA